MTWAETPVLFIKEVTGQRTKSTSFHGQGNQIGKGGKLPARAVHQRPGPLHILKRTVRRSAPWINEICPP